MASASSKSNKRTTRTKDASTAKTSQDTDTEPLLNQNSQEGKTLVWRNLVATVPIHSKTEKNERKTVINDVSGAALPGEVLAIMGGSGAGKTTLMNMLAHLDTKGVEKKGTILVNGRTVSKTEMRSISAYVQQIDLFCGTLTVREQLTYSALLRMGPSFSHAEKMERVEQVIKEMNLTDAQNTLIGIPNRTKGISIGEKKRLAFACEVLTDPAVLFCDEPTSGLDAFMASQVVSALRLMTKKGKTIVTVIHQPSSTVFNMFHKVLFMANGKPAFHGPVDKLCDFFASLNDPTLRVPESYNPADHAIAKLSIAPATKEKDIEQIKLIAENYEKSEMGQELKKLVESNNANPENSAGDGGKKQRYAASFPTQMNVLFRRAFLTTLRDPLLLKVRVIQVVLTAVIIGIVNWNTPLVGPAIQNLEGVMYNTARDMNFLFIFPSINVITSELPVFMREHKGRIYSVESYYLSKSLAELPQYCVLPLAYSAIVYWTTGLWRAATNFAIFCAVCTLLTQNAISVAYAGACVFGDEGMAVTFLPMIILPMLVFGGFYINIQNIPSYLRPISHLSWFKYGFEALQINQWRTAVHIPGCTGRLSAGNNTDFCPSEDGPGLLRKRGMDGSLLVNILVLSVFFVGYRVIGLIALILRTKFAK